MGEIARYLKWLSYLCLLMGCFGVGVLIIGYKGPSFGRVTTVVALFAATVILRFLSKRQEVKYREGKREETKSQTLSRKFCAEVARTPTDNDQPHQSVS